jgi:hypothetical protein
MNFLNHREKGNGFLSGFPPLSFMLYSNCTVDIVRGCVNLKKSQGKAVEVTVNSKTEKRYRLLSGFVQESGLVQRRMYCIYTRLLTPEDIEI